MAQDPVPLVPVDPVFPASVFPHGERKRDAVFQNRRLEALIRAVAQRLELTLERDELIEIDGSCRCAGDGYFFLDVSLAVINISPPKHSDANAFER